MNITILAGYFSPEQSADTHLNADLAADFAALGANVTVVVPFPSRGITAQEQQDYLARRDEQIAPNLRVIRVGEPTSYHSGLIARGLNLLKKSWLLYRQALKLETDVYFVVSTPPFLGYAGALLSRKAPVVYKLQDVFPDSLIHAGKLKANSIPIRLLRILERWVYRSVSHINACSSDVKKTIVARNIDPDKVSVIYDWIDENACVPVARQDNVLFERFGLPRDQFYVSYAGNIGLLQNVETILRAAARLREDVPDIKFVIIGDGAWRARMEQIIQAEKLTNVLHFPMQPVDDVSYVYSLGDAEIVSLKPGVSRMALPSKTWSILSAARPAICEIDLGCELETLIDEYACGASIAPGDDAALAQKILEIYRLSAEERAAMGVRGRAFVEKHLSRSYATAAHFQQMKDQYEKRR